MQKSWYKGLYGSYIWVWKSAEINWRLKTAENASEYRKKCRRNLLNTFILRTCLGRKKSLLLWLLETSKIFSKLHKVNSLIKNYLSEQIHGFNFKHVQYEFETVLCKQDTLSLYKTSAVGSRLFLWNQQLENIRWVTRSWELWKAARTKWHIGWSLYTHNLKTPNWCLQSRNRVKLLWKVICVANWQMGSS